LDDFHLQENGQSLNSKLKDWFLARQEKGDGINRVQGQNARGLRSEVRRSDIRNLRWWNFDILMFVPV